MIDDPVNPGRPLWFLRFVPEQFRQRLPVSASLGDRSRRAGVWIVAGIGGQRAIQLTSNLILTRLLFPEAFGLMALATVFLIGLAMFSDLGLKPAIIRDKRSDDPKFLNTAWTIQAIRGLVLAIAACAIAWPVSRIYGQPVLFPMLCLISTTSVLSGFTCIRIVTAERDLAMRQVTLTLLGGQLGGAIVLIGLALSLESVWALAIGSVLGAAIALALGHYLLPGHRHRLVIDRAASADLLRFGRWIFVSTAVTFVGSEGLRAVQAAYVPIGVFGILAIAQSFAAIPSDMYGRLTGGIGLPALSEVHRSNPDGLRAALRKFRLPLLAVSFCAFAGLALLARPLIATFYDSRYHDAGTYLELLLMAGVFAMIPAGYLNALLAAGKPRTYLTGMICITSFRVMGVYFGFIVGEVNGMLIGLSAANLLAVLAVWAIAQRHSILDLSLDVSMIGAALALFALLAMLNGLY